MTHSKAELQANLNTVYAWRDSASDEPGSPLDTAANEALQALIDMHVRGLHVTATRVLDLATDYQVEAWQADAAARGYWRADDAVRANLAEDQYNRFQYVSDTLTSLASKLH